MDTFRREYREMSREDSEMITRLKEKAEELETMLRSSQMKGGREAAIAITSLETCIMWAIKSVTA